jgi:hypothetical protein
MSAADRHRGAHRPGREPEEIRTAALGRVVHGHGVAGAPRPAAPRPPPEDRWLSAGLPFADDQAALAWLDAETPT